jgi:HlyD family secretion protein
MALLAAVAAGIALFLRWRAAQPVPVVVIHPQPRPITETVAASGQVGGKRETTVGSQIQGVVAQLWVDESAVVRRGQPLARIQSDTQQAQVQQAEQALRTARAQLVEAAAGPRPSEVNAARAQVTQAEATVRQRAAAVQQARSMVAQAEARRDLARQNLERDRYLLQQGAIARQEVDQAESAYRTAVAEVAAAQDAVRTAQANRAAAEAALAAARAQLRTVEAGPRAETVAVARQRVRDAEAALRVAEAQARNAIVRAPYAGTITQILAWPGTLVGLNSGVVRLVQTGLPEIRVDVDESNLAALKVGQRAVITSSTFRDVRLGARVTRIGAQVDPTRGTVTITLIPDKEPAWLRPGQTVNVNIVTGQGVTRLLIPRSAVQRQGGAVATTQTGNTPSIVLVVRDGRAVAQQVILGPVEGDLVPVLEGLTAHDPVVRDADKVQPGAAVRIRAGR